MNTIWIFLFIISFSYLFYLILKHKQSRRELGKGATHTALETAYTFGKGTIKTVYKASKSAIKAEHKNRKLRKENENRY